MGNSRYKFRAWDPIENQMYENVVVVDGMALRREYFATDFMTKLSQRLILMQYTGLQDCHGKEICEGDIVKSIMDFGSEEYPDDREIIETVDYRAGCFFPICDMPSTEYEIIGNIYEGEKSEEVEVLDCGCDGYYQLFGVHRPGCRHWLETKENEEASSLNNG
jgi:uncharacterized phage protein (TIGR01671 family)